MSFTTPVIHQAGAAENVNDVNANNAAVAAVLDNGISYKENFDQAVLGLLSHVYNAADFGTFGTGAAIQAAIDQVEDDGGGAVYIPQGDWTVNTAITLPLNTSIHLFGYGRPLAGAALGGGTRLIRTSGTNTIISATASSDINTGDGYHVRISGLEMRGSGTAGYLLDAAACNPLELEDIEFTGVDGTGVRLRQIYNSTGRNLRFAAMGDEGTTAAAVILGGLAVSQGGCDTVLWSQCQFEGNDYSDLRLTGDAASGGSNTANRNCNSLQFENVKMEAGTGSGPYIDLDYAQKCKFTTVNIANAARTGPVIVETNGFTGSQPNHFNGLTVEYNSTPPSSAQYTMYLQTGGWLIGTLNVISGGTLPTTALIRVDSGGNSLRYNPRTIFWEAGTSDKIVSDGRSSPSVASASTITLPFGEPKVQVTGTTTVNTITLAPIGTLVVLDFTGVCTVKDGTGNLALAGDFTTAANATLTLVAGSTTWREAARSTN